MDIIKKPVVDLVGYDKNARTHSDQQIEEIAQSIKNFGFNDPIEIGEDNVIISGHARLAAAIKLNMEEVPVIIHTHMTEKNRKAYVLAANRIAMSSSWDAQLLQEEMLDLHNSEFDLSLTGFTDEEINDILDLDEVAENLADEDDCPGVPEDPVTKIGDVWLLGEHHRLMCGNSVMIDDVDKLMNGQKADLVFTDPPYGYKYESGYQNKHTMLLNDDKILDFAPVAFAFMKEDSAIYTCSSFQTISQWIDHISKIFTYKNLIVWKKNNWSMDDLKGSFAGQHELIIFAHKGRVELIGKRDPDVWEFSRTPPDLHPTQKPIDLVEYAISKVKSDIVLDLFGGSGSTLIACEKLKRKCFTMELSEKYCDVIVARYEQFTGKKARLEGDDNGNGRT